MSVVKIPIGYLETGAAFGGAELNLLRNAAWMRERGWQVTVIGRPAAPFAVDAAQRALPVRELRPPWRYGDLPAARRLAATVIAEGIRILVLGSRGDIHTAVLARILARKRFAIVYSQQMQLGARKQDWFHAWEYRHIAAWVAPLPGLARQAAEWTNIPADRIHVVPLGIDLDPFLSDRPSRTEARELMKLPADAFIAGVVGRLDRGKGQEYLLDAAALLEQRGIALHALLVGEETRNERQAYSLALREKAASLGIGGRVHFRPFRADIVPAYRAMDAFVLTSLSETFGMVTVEALASGLPVVATDSAGTVEIVRDGTTGLLVPPADAPALAGALERLIRDPDRARALGSAAREDAVRRFSHHIQCEGYERIFARIASDG